MSEPTKPHQEDRARFLNEISQTDIHFDSASKKIQDAYRAKAGWILDWLSDRLAQAPHVPVSPEKLAEVDDKFDYFCANFAQDPDQEIVDRDLVKRGGAWMKHLILKAMRQLPTLQPDKIAGQSGNAGVKE